jgi:hypothetical protein
MLTSWYFRIRFFNYNSFFYLISKESGGFCIIIALKMKHTEVKSTEMKRIPPGKRTSFKKIRSKIISHVASGGPIYEYFSKYFDQFLMGE